MTPDEKLELQRLLNKATGVYNHLAWKDTLRMRELLNKQKVETDDKNERIREQIS